MMEVMISAIAVGGRGCLPSIVAGTGKMVVAAGEEVDVALRVAELAVKNAVARVVGIGGSIGLMVVAVASLNRVNLASTILVGDWVEEGFVVEVVLRMDSVVRSSHTVVTKNLVVASSVAVGTGNTVDSMA